MMQRAAVIGGLWLAACAPAVTAPEASAPTARADAQTPPATSAALNPEGDTAGPSAPTPAEPPPPTADTKAPAPGDGAPPAGPSIRELCLGMCDKVKERCPKSAFDSCKVNCGKYDPPPAGCEGAVRSALSCARDAADLVCANVAPESCAKPFRQLSACASGQKPADSEPGPAALPAGFKVHQLPAEGISAPMPEGVAAGSGDVLATVKHTDGGTYAIRKLARPAGKLNEKVFLKTAMNLFGRCTDKMKMQGMVDKPGRTSISYTMKCPDGAEEAGLFWATDKALYIASVRGGSAQQATDAFLYGFEVK